jgi:hypothetical protein
MTNEELLKIAIANLADLQERKSLEAWDSQCLASIAASLLVIARHFDTIDSPSPEATLPPMTKPQRDCNGVHCRCMDKNCSNAHPYDHVCRYTDGRPPKMKPNTGESFKNGL